MRQELFALVLLSLGALSGCAAFDTDREVDVVLLHSDLPLWRAEPGDRVWPEHFYSERSFGCRSQIPFGVWRETEIPPAGEEWEPEEELRRIDNYGVFHCAYLFSYGVQRDPAETGLLVELGHDPESGRTLYAFQIGMRPGSTYELLAGDSPQDGMLERFDVLGPDCSAGTLRSAGPIDVWLTEYCAVSSKRDLVSIARKAVRRRPVGTLEFVSNEREADPGAASPDLDAPAPPASQHSP